MRVSRTANATCARKVIVGGVAATRAADALRPAASDKIGRARIFIREQFIELRSGQLMNGLGLFVAGHGARPLSDGRTLACLKSLCQLGIIALTVNSLGLIVRAEGYWKALAFRQVLAAS